MPATVGFGEWNKFVSLDSTDCSSPSMECTFCSLDLQYVQYICFLHGLQCIHWLYVTSSTRDMTHALNLYPIHCIRYSNVLTYIKYDLKIHLRFSILICSKQQVEVTRCDNNNMILHRPPTRKDYETWLLGYFSFLPPPSCTNVQEGLLRIQIRNCSVLLRLNLLHCKHKWNINRPWFMSSDFDVFCLFGKCCVAPKGVKSVLYNRTVIYTTTLKKIIFFRFIKYLSIFYCWRYKITMHSYFTEAISHAGA